MLTIHPEDFHGTHEGTDAPSFRTWTPGKLEHLVAVLAGDHVIVEVDRMTGHSVRGRLIGLRPHGGMFDGRPHLVVEYGYEYAHGTGAPFRTAYPVSDIGIIVEVAIGAKSKWDALNAKRKAEAVALDTLRAVLRDQGHDVDGHGPGAFYGRWHVTGTGFGAYGIRYEPQSDDAAQADYWVVDVSV